MSFLAPSHPQVVLLTPTPLVTPLQTTSRAPSPAPPPPYDPKFAPWSLEVQQRVCEHDASGVPVECLCHHHHHHHHEHAHTLGCQVVPVATLVTAPSTPVVQPMPLQSTTLAPCVPTATAPILQPVQVQTIVPLVPVQAQVPVVHATGWFPRLVASLPHPQPIFSRSPIQNNASDPLTMPTATPFPTPQRAPVDWQPFAGALVRRRRMQPEQTGDNARVGDAMNGEQHREPLDRGMLSQHLRFPDTLPGWNEKQGDRIQEYIAPIKPSRCGSQQSFQAIGDH